MEPGETPSSCIVLQLTRLADTAIILFSDEGAVLPNENSLPLD